VRKFSPVGTKSLRVVIAAVPVQRAEVKARIAFSALFSLAATIETDLDAELV
jgi:hypothetical protein